MRNSKIKQNISPRLSDIIKHKGKQRFIDEVFSQIEAAYGIDNINDILHVGGSVAKIMEGLIDKVPKDLDLTTKDEKLFHFLQKYARKIFPNYRIDIRKKRVIIDNGYFVTEIWLDKSGYQIIEINGLKLQDYGQHK